MITALRHGEVVADVLVAQPLTAFAPNRDATLWRATSIISRRSLQTEAGGESRESFQEVAKGRCFWGRNSAGEIQEMWEDEGLLVSNESWVAVVGTRLTAGASGDNYFKDPSPLPTRGY